MSSNEASNLIPSPRRLLVYEQCLSRVIGLDVDLSEPVAVANIRRIAFGVITEGAAALQLIAGDSPDIPARIQLNDNQLYWYHYEKYRSFVRLPFWLIGSAPGATATIYEVLIP